MAGLTRLINPPVTVPSWHPSSAVVGAAPWPPPGPRRSSAAQPCTAPPPRRHDAVASTPSLPHTTGSLCFHSSTPRESTESAPYPESRDQTAHLPASSLRSMSTPETRSPRRSVPPRTGGDTHRQTWSAWRLKVRVQLGVVAGMAGSHGPAVNSWVSTSRRSMPCLVAVDR